VNAAKKVGSVDYLVNNAGTGITDDFLKLKLEDFDKTMRTNVYSTLVMS
jgi:NADP-dependent 3-hydroxy acid dehydrogenase YdfG